MWLSAAKLRFLCSDLDFPATVPSPGFLLNMHAFFIAIKAAERVRQMDRCLGYIVLPTTNRI